MGRVNKSSLVAVLLPGIILLSLALIYTSASVFSAEQIVPTAGWFPYYSSSPIEMLSRITFASWGHDDLGIPLLFHSPMTPYVLLVTIPSILVGPVLWSMLLAFILLTATGFTYYLFLRRALKFSALGSLLGALFASWNLWFTQYVITGRNIAIALSYLALPVALYFAYQYLTKSRITYAFVSALAVGLSFSHQPSGIIVLTSVILYVIVFECLSFQRQKAKSIIAKVAILTAVIFFATSYILPCLFWSAADPTAVNALPSLASPSIQLGKLEMGMTVVKPPYVFLGLLNWPEAGTFIIPVMLLIVLGIIGVVASRKQQLLPFLFLYLVSVYMAKGLNAPFQAGYAWLANLNPILNMALRDPVHWLLLVNMCISVFIASSVRVAGQAKQYFHSKFSTRRRPSQTKYFFYTCNSKKDCAVLLKKASVATLLIIGILVLSISLVVYSEFTTRKYQPLSLPAYYRDATDYLDRMQENDTFRLYFPGSRAATNYEWSKGQFLEVPILGQLYPSITRYSLLGLGAQELNLFQPLNAIEEEKAGDYVVPELLGLLNIKYVVIQNDLVPNDWYNPLPELERALTFPRLSAERTFGQIQLLANERYRPNVYVPNWIVPFDSFESFIDSARAVSFYNRTVDVGYIDEASFSNIASAIKGENQILPAYTENQPTVVVDNQQVAFWKTYVEGTGAIGQATVSDSTYERENGVNSLKAVVNKGNFAVSQIVHDYPSPQDWSAFDILSLYWYGTNSGKTIDVFLYTSPLPPEGYNYYKWSFQDDFEGWQWLAFSLKMPNDPSYPSYGSPSLSEVSSIRIGLPEGTWYLGPVVLDYGLVSPVPLRDTAFYEVDAPQPHLDVTRLNYDEYSVHITNISGPFLIILSDAYSPLWKIVFDNSSAENVQVTHLKANWYANAWLVKSSLSSLDISIVYEGRNYMLLSVGLLILFVVTTALVLAVELRKRLLKHLINK